MYKRIDDIRQEFLDFFKKRKHQVIPSSSLIPNDDSTLLFTNSGMNQFKNIFLGIETSSLKRVVTVQRCMRAGGKHNDLDNVGYTGRHLTFFEMLGNFSFGDYFKRDAIQFAWELLTDVNWFNLSPDKLWVTTHICDNDSYDIWTKDINFPKNRVIKIGNNKSNFHDSFNFWQMGNVGPCGPCSEIFYDFGDGFVGDPPGNTEKTGNRYIEIWNLVFMQFNRQENGELIELPVFSVDTGMGLERITSILQGVHSNYLIDVFKNLIDSISQIMKVKKSITNKSLYVVADHIRACAFLIKDGIVPSNEGQGYVLRRIIRRSVLHGKKLGVNNIFLYKLVTPLIVNMSYITDILHDYKDLIEQILFNEEKLFALTLEKGLRLLEKELIQLECKGSNMLSGEIAFRLYTTYGFPLDLTKDVCYERNVQVDHIIFDKKMLEEKKSSKQLNRFYMNSNDVLPCNIVSKFVGYKCFSYQSKIIALFQNNKPVHVIYENKESMVILDFTPFYGESGGQIGDSGYLKTVSGVFQVINTKKYRDTIIHIGLVNNGCINLGEQVYAQVNQVKRKQISLNHSATHLLHTALLKILGGHVVQKGSLVSSEYLRFDFSHYTSVTELQINDIENLINQQIWNNLSIVSDVVSMEFARSIGAIMLSQTQYNEKVRVLQIGNFSVELCGGTHAERTGEIGLFSIIKECSVGFGIRRIEAVTQNIALSLMQRKKILVKNILSIFQSDDENLLNTISKFRLRFNKLKKEIKYIHQTQEIQTSVSFMQDISYIKGVYILIKPLDNAGPKMLFNMIKNVKAHIKSGIIILINFLENNTLCLLISVTKDLIRCNRIDALSLTNSIIEIYGGKFEGKLNFSQIVIDNIVVKSVFLKKLYTLLHNML